MANKNPEWSDNSTAYFQLWVKTLHQNCKGKVGCTCHVGAYDLTVRRLESIKRGMPDLSQRLESKIWDRAFDIHKDSCVKPNGYAGSISPTWSDSIDYPKNVCNCFERAYEEYNKKAEKKDVKKVKTHIKKVVEEPLFEERVV